MRNSDSPWPEYQKPLGEKVEPTKPRDTDWKPYYDINGQRVKGVEVNSDGKVRTALPLPKYPRWFPA